MKLNFLRFGLSFLVMLVARSQAAFATAGLAEWKVLTPGGNEIDGSDRVAPQFGIALVAATPSGIDSPEPQIVISNIKRWRYYPGYVALEGKDGYFLVNESSLEKVRFDSESELPQRLRELSISESLSEWMNPDDGYEEAWYPYFFWPKCALKTGELSLSEFSVEQRAAYQSAAPFFQTDCSVAAVQKKLALFSKTGWGRRCKALKSDGSELKDSEHQMILKQFCVKLLSN